MIKNYKFKFFIILYFLLFIGENSFAIEPKEFVQITVNRASEVLNTNLTKEQKMEKLKIIAEDAVDIRGIGLYSLGGHRKSISDQNKIKYLQIFKDYFLKSFSSRLAQYSDPRIRVISQKKLNTKYTMVSSTLLSTEKTPEVKIDWRVITKNIEKPLIIDVIIEGVSLAKVQREEFNSIIQNNDGNIEVLLKNLNDFVFND